MEGEGENVGEDEWGCSKQMLTPPLKFNWIGLLPIQLNLFPTHTSNIQLMHVKLQNYP